MKFKNNEKIYQVGIFIVVLITSLMCLYPIIYVLGLSLTSEAEWVNNSGYVIWPKNPTFLAYKRVMQDSSVFLNAFKISVIRTLVGTTITLAACLVTGYVLSRRYLPGKRFLLFCVLATILFNGGLIPTYLVVKQTKIYDSIWALIIPLFLDSWSVLVFKQFFGNIPLEIEESAQVDGVGELTLMFKIIVPMSKPVMAAIGLFVAVAHWNAWFDALIYIKTDTLKPLQLIMRNMFANMNIGWDMNSKVDMDPTNRVSMQSLRMAVAVIGTVPILIIYPFLQKYFTKGVYVGSVKG